MEINVELVERLREKLQPMPEFINKFINLELRDNTTLKTRTAYADEIRLFLSYLITLDKFNLNDIKEFTVPHMDLVTKEDIQGFLTSVEAHTVTVRSRANKEYKQTFTNGKAGKARKVSCIRKLFGYLYNLEYNQETGIGPIRQDVSKKIKVSQPDSDLRSNILNKEEINRILNAIETGDGIKTDREAWLHEQYKLRDMAIMTIFMGTGIRVSELVGLNIEDVNFIDGYINVLRKGESPESVYFSQEVSDILNRYYQNRITITAVKAGSENALFLSHQKQRITVKSVEVLIKKYSRRAEVSKPITPHSLRRTFGTELYNSTGDIYLVADALGHENVQTTKDHYATLNTNRKRDALMNYKIKDDNDELK